MSDDFDQYYFPDWQALNQGLAQVCRDNDFSKISDVKVSESSQVLDVSSTAALEVRLKSDETVMSDVCTFRFIEMELQKRGGNSADTCFSFKEYDFLVDEITPQRCVDVLERKFEVIENLKLRNLQGGARKDFAGVNMILEDEFIKSCVIIDILPIGGVDLTLNVCVTFSNGEQIVVSFLERNYFLSLIRSSSYLLAPGWMVIAPNEDLFAEKLEKIVRSCTHTLGLRKPPGFLLYPE